VTAALTVTQLTIRQFLRAKSVLVVAGICMIPVLFAIILRLADPELSIADMREILGEALFLGLFSSTLLPLASLVLSTAAIGDEVDDKTLQYLMLKPMSRLRIVIEKLLGTLLVIVPIAWAALLAVWLVVSWGELDATRDMVWPMLAASLAGIAGFGALFMLISLYAQRALLVGVFYVFIWEATLSQFLPGIRTISVRQYMQSIFIRLLDDPVIVGVNEQDSAARLSTATITIVAIVAVSVLWSAWRLRRMNLE
jgi:ABC-2 type transport system permease protein